MQRLGRSAPPLSPEFALRLSSWHFPDVRLAICIPTHHGRRDTLRTLLDSIVSQVGIPSGQLEVCISDNASTDGTADLVASYQATSPFPISYHRFERDMRGARNFNQAVEMATADWCWFVGSDDALIPGAIARALEALDIDMPGGGFTCNKVNLDKTLTAYHSVDHDIALPSQPDQSRPITPERVVEELAIAFSYMSAHIFRRSAWRVAVEERGIAFLETLRHFSHVYMFATIARRWGWSWLADYLVIQRLDNFCTLEQLGGDGARYADELTHDLFAAYTAVLERDSTSERPLARRLFVIYWNPVAVLGFHLDRRQRLAAFRLCSRWFRHVPLFWLTTAPLLLSPVVPRIAATSSAARQQSRALRSVLRVLGLESADRSGPGRAAAAAYLASAVAEGASRR
jgi:glycosyltransferase involved in cell wall biosynthesis